MALLARLNPSLGSYTCITSNGKPPLIGHVQYTAGSRSARLIFLMPEDGLAQPELVHLVERLATQAGEWGAFHLLAEVEENSCALEGLRRSGFLVYAWQRIWQFSAAAANSKHDRSLWQPAASIDEIGIRSLYQSLVPPLVQSAEPLTTRRLSGWVYRQDGEILAYVEGIYGSHGIYLLPLIHPAVENVSQVLTNLLAHQQNWFGRPIYMTIRSYQAWLETVVRDLECQIGPRQALMVKHLVLHQRAFQSNRHSVLEKYATETTAPMVQNSSANELH